MERANKTYYLVDGVFKEIIYNNKLLSGKLDTKTITEIEKSKIKEVK